MIGKDMPPSHGLFGKDWGEWAFLWSGSCEQVPDGVSCSASSRISSTRICTVHVTAHPRRLPNVLFGASTAQLQIPLTTFLLLKDAQMSDYSSSSHATSMSKQPPQVFVVLVCTLVQASQRLLINLM